MQWLILRMAVKMTSERLLVFDFDGTTHNTFEASPNGIGVNEAYDLAIKNVFGTQGTIIYDNKLGKLKNRAPTELVSNLMEKDGDGTLLRNARKFFEDNFLRLLKIMPENYNQGSFVSDDLENLNSLLTWMLISDKCSHMLDQIGKNLSSGDMWPRPCKGFLEFYKFIENQDTDFVSINTAIVSSGHKEFIRRTFGVYGLKMPDYVVTDDEMRKIRLPVLRKTKPAPYPFAVIHNQWVKDRNLSGQQRFDKTGIIYFGDDSIKDGLLAHNCRITFGQYKEGLVDGLVASDNGDFRFGDWNEIKNLMIRQKINLEKNIPWSKIINNYAKQ
jgi:hypothetical protein